MEIANFCQVFFLSVLIKFKKKNQQIRQSSVMFQNLSAMGSYVVLVKKSQLLIHSAEVNELPVYTLHSKGNAWEKPWSWKNDRVE